MSVVNEVTQCSYETTLKDMGLGKGIETRSIEYCWKAIKGRFAETAMSLTRVLRQEMTLYMV